MNRIQNSELTRLRPKATPRQGSKNTERSFAALRMTVGVLFAIMMPAGTPAVRGAEAFAIFSPVLGLREDAPAITLAQAFTTDNQNVIMRDGEIHRCRMREPQFLHTGAKTAVPDANPILRFHYYEKASGQDYLVAFTADHAYTWDNTADAWDLIHTCASAATRWSSVTYADKLYATNNIDKIQVWDGTGIFEILEADKDATGTVTTVNGDATIEGDTTDWVTSAIAAGDIIYISGDTVPYTIASVTDLNTLELTANWTGTGAASLSYAIKDNVGIDIGGGNYLTKAAFLVNYSGYLMAWDVTVGGTRYPFQGYWCDTYDPDDWASGNAGYIALPGPDPVIGAGQIGTYLEIFSGRAVDELWATDGTDIFNYRRSRNQLGSYSPDSITNGANGELYFLDNQRNFRRMDAPLSEMVKISPAVDKTLKLIPDAYAYMTQAVYVPGLEQMWLAFPYGIDQTTNNKMLCLDTLGAWTRRDMAAAAFGVFEQSDALDDWADLSIYDAWADWGWEDWDSPAAMADYRIDLVSDYSGYGYGSHHGHTDDGSAFTGYAVIGSDFAAGRGTPGLDRYKRLVSMTVYFRNEGGGTADIALKRDTETSWQTVTSVSLSGAGDILWQRVNCDYRARYYELKVSGANPFRFLGCVFYYVTEGLN